MLLQFAIEQRLGHGFEEDAQRLAFRPLGMTDSSLHWQDRFAGRLADGWQVDGTAILHDRRDNVRVAGSMDTTIADMAKFASALVTGVGLSQASHQAMLAPQLPITTATQFPTLQSEVPQARRVAGLAAGLGVVVFDGPQGRGFYKGGHDDQTGNVMVCLRQGQRCVVLLGNDVRAERAFPAIVKAVLGDTGVPWQWEYGIQQP
ncbi:serine hydrolase domain-containing protein [Sphingomonas daechungensis]|uniref:serine hydrolase domain-containing protein n=1 Tax=Sphingomonas daechungensis TaxID=1176646 RepID=UPI001CB9C3B2|nr:serine hydrolase domain-containing protein [Sphingomonas daechungensis]